MITHAEARSLALALPEAVERDHHGRPSFRVAGKIFATLWDETHMNLMLERDGILTAVQSHPHACTEFWWGKRLAAASVSLEGADAELLAELLDDAWENTAPDEAFDAWLTDRVARRPAGRRARATYGADDVHDFARRAILDALQLRAGDRLLEVAAEAACCCARRLQAARRPPAWITATRW